MTQNSNVKYVFMLRGGCKKNPFNFAQNQGIFRVPTQPGKREKSVKLNIALPALEKSLN